MGRTPAHLVEQGPHVLRSSPCHSSRGFDFNPQPSAACRPPWKQGSTKETHRHRCSVVHHVTHHMTHRVPPLAQTGHVALQVVNR